MGPGAIRNLLFVNRYSRVTFEKFQELSGRLSVKGDMRQNPVGGSSWIRVSISIGVGLFIFALAVSAFFVPQLRLLHVFQALIYVAVIVLTRRNSPWGFGIGVIIPAAWNCLNLFVTHLFQKGAVQFWSLVRTGHVSRPETMMVTVGGVAHFLLIVACVAGFLQLRPRGKRWGQFFGGGILASAYFALIIAIAAPR
jgi:hypothetical protein